MSTVLNQKWEKVDEFEEETYYKNIKFTRPVGDTPISLDCSFCKVLISTIEDVEKMKSYNICHSCYDLYYYPNKEKWDKGWRPNK